MKHTSKNHTWHKSFLVAFQGFLLALKEERSVRRAVYFAVTFITFTGFFHTHYLEVLIIIVAWTQVVVYEMFNTALEKTLDYSSNYEYHQLIKHAKDFAAGSVFLSSLLGVIIFLVIMANYLGIRPF